MPTPAIVGWSDGAITGLILAMRKPELVARLFAFGANASLDGMKAGGSRTPLFRDLFQPLQDRVSDAVAGARQMAEAARRPAGMWHSQLHITKRKLAAIKSPTTISVGQYDELIKPDTPGNGPCDPGRAARHPAGCQPLRDAAEPGAVQPDAGRVPRHLATAPAQKRLAPTVVRTSPPLKVQTWSLSGPS